MKFIFSGQWHIFYKLYKNKLAIWHGTQRSLKLTTVPT